MVPKKSMTSVLIFTTFTNYQQHYVQISCLSFHQNQINVEIIDGDSLLPISKVWLLHNRLNLPISGDIPCEIFYPTQKKNVENMGKISIPKQTMILTAPI
jgi:hypothetical protein